MNESQRAVVAQAIVRAFGDNPTALLTRLLSREDCTQTCMSETEWMATNAPLLAPGITSRAWAAGWAKSAGDADSSARAALAEALETQARAWTERACEILRAG